MKFNYYNFRSESFNCPKCNWIGLGNETFLSELSEIHTLRNIECPKCNETLHTFDLAEVNEQQQKLGNPGPLEKVCFNCENMMWMVGIGQGVKCNLTKKDIPSRLHTCVDFKYK